MDTSSIWPRLRAWIDEKEAYERYHNKPAPLTQKEVSGIRSILPEEKPKEIEMDDTDWVSALNLLLQKNGVALPMFEDEAVKRPLQQHADRWRFWCIFENGKKFPKAGFGHDIGEEPPSFTSKKRAKNFTAMQVIKYLRSEPRLAGSLQTDITLGSGGRGLPSLSTLSSAAKRVKRESQSPSPSTNHNLPTTANIPNNDSMSKTVAETAVSLGMEAPRIEVTPDENLKDGFYKGCAVWNLGARVPEGLGSVRGILGSKECKAQVEQTLLKWMQEEVHRRESVAQSLLSRTA